MGGVSPATLTTVHRLSWGGDRCPADADRERVGAGGAWLRPGVANLKPMRQMRLLLGAGSSYLAQNGRPDMEAFV